MQASTDSLDLLGISKMLLNCRGNCSPAQSGIYWDLRMHVRQRRKLVNMASGMKNRIHTTVDRIFPGFLDETKSGIAPFSKCSLLLAEIGNPDKQKSLSNIVSYSGIIPKVKQTGGIQGKTRIKKVGKRCNHILKDYVVQSASHMGLHGPEDLMLDYKRRDAQGQHADFGMARRFLRMAMGLMRTYQTYLPKRLRSTKINMKERAAYYLIAWPKLREKWHKANSLDIAFDKDMPLGQWRKVIQELYGIELKL